jgi:hypothetical protein
LKRKNGNRYCKVLVVSVWSVVAGKPQGKRAKCGGWAATQKNLIKM